MTIGSRVEKVFRGKRLISNLMMSIGLLLLFTSMTYATSVEVNLYGYYNEDYNLFDDGYRGFFDYFDTNHVSFPELPGVSFYVKTKMESGPHVLSSTLAGSESFSITINQSGVKKVYVLGTGTYLATDFGHKLLWCDDINHFSFTLNYSDGSSAELFPTNVLSGLQRWSDILHGYMYGFYGVAVGHFPASDWGHYHLYEIPVDSNKTLATITMNDKAGGTPGIDPVGDYTMLALSLSLVEAPPPSDGWPLMAHDAQRTGSTPDSLTLPLILADSLVVGNDCAHQSTPVVEDGVAYIGGVGKCITAYEVSTGNVIWEWCRPDYNLLVTPCVYGGFLFVGADTHLAAGNMIYKLNKSDGSVVDSADLPARPQPVCVQNDRAYVAYSNWYDGYGPFGIISFDANNLSNVLWNHPNPIGHGYGPPTISKDGSKLYASDDAGALTCIDALTGNKIWRYPTGHLWGSNMPTLMDSVVYFVAGSNNLNLYALEATTGNPLWIKHFADYGSASQSMAVSENILCVSANRYSLYAFDLLNEGNVLWSFVRDDGMWSPSIAGGTVFVPSYSSIYALDILTGEELWSQDLESVHPQYLGPAIANDDLFMLAVNQDSDAVMYRFSSAEPAPNVVMSPDPIYVYWAYAMDPMTDTVFIGDFAGGYTAADVDAGSLLLNGSISPISTGILDTAPGFDGQVLAAYFSMSEFIMSYPPLLDTTEQEYTVTGQFNDASSFEATGFVTMIGKIQGDLNCDMKVNMLDIAVLTGYIFRGGQPSTPEEAGDVDESGYIDIDDVVCLVNYVFLGTPFPASSRDDADPISKSFTGSAEVQINRLSNDMPNSYVINVNSDTEIQGIQIEINSDNPDEVDVTGLIEGMELLSGTVDGNVRIGLVDLNGKHVLPQGVTDIVRVQVPSGAEIHLNDVILVKSGGGKINVQFKSNTSEPITPMSYALHQNYPNPFNPTTIISFDMINPGDYSLTIYNLMGQVVDKITGTASMAGTVSVEWNALDKASGVYFYRLEAGDFTQTKKMMLMK